MEFAPVLVSVLDRNIHFQNCITSLSKNPLANQTHLFIALDAPFAEKHIAGHAKVLTFIESIKGFKEVTLFKRESNMGSSENQFLAMQFIFAKYDRLIFTEDDNVFSPNFLDFINQGLELFKDREDIFAVTGHNYKVDIPESYPGNYYIWPGFDAWGVGLWKEKWYKVDFTVKNKQLDALKPTKILKLNSIAGHYVPALFQLAKFGILHDDFAIDLHLVENKMYSVFPTISKVRNTGLDGSGENGGLSGMYQDQHIDKNANIQLSLDIGAKPNKAIFRILKKHFRTPNKRKIKLLFRYLQLLAARIFIKQ
jgi:hypothetical protein